MYVDDGPSDRTGLNMKDGENPTNQNDKSTLKNYANVTKPKRFCPKRKLAVVLNSIKDIPKEEYAFAVGDKIGPTNVTHAEKISHDRVCVFLKTENLVTELVEKYSEIQVKDQYVKIRRYITPASRLIISNACPSIPHELIEKQLENCGLKLLSEMNFLNAGIKREGYTHILSFRRHVYVEHNEKIKIPETLVVENEETRYRIFIMEDTLKCTICSKYGHKPENCKYLSQTNVNNASQPSTSQNLQTQTFTNLNQYLQLSTNKQTNLTNTPVNTPTCHTIDNSSINETNTQIIQINTPNTSKHSAENSQNQAQCSQNKETEIQSTQPSNTSTSITGNSQSDNMGTKIENFFKKIYKNNSEKDQQINKNKTEQTKNNEKHDSTKENEEIDLNDNKDASKNKTPNEAKTLTQTKAKRHALSISSLEDDSFEIDNLREDILTQPDPSQQDGKTASNKSSNNKTKQKVKKQKSDFLDSNIPNSIEEALTPLKEEINNNSAIYILSYDNLIEFLDRAHTTSEQLKVAREYTSDISGLLFAIKDIHELIEDRSTKNKLTRLIKRIREEIRRESDYKDR